MKTFLNRNSLLNYYRNLEAKDCAVTFAEVIDHSGFNFYTPCLGIAEQVIIDVWLRANELHKQGVPNYLKKAAMDVWRETVVRRGHAKSGYWQLREDRDMEALEDEPLVMEPWLADVICAEVQKRGLVKRLFKIVGLPEQPPNHQFPEALDSNP